MNLKLRNLQDDGYSLPEVDRIWVVWGSYSSIPKAIFYLLKVDYILAATRPFWGIFLK